MELSLEERFKPLLNKLVKDEIKVKLAEMDEIPVGASKFGGQPDLPKDHKWDYYNGKPISFLVQINLAEASKYDTEGLLPKSGTLSFFYDIEEQPWGYDPKDRGDFKIYYFPEGTELVRTPLPEDMEDYCEVPEHGIELCSHVSYPDLSELDEYAEDNGLEYPECSDEENDGLWDAYSDFTEREETDETKLFGYAELVQNPMREQCEEVAVRGYYVGNGNYSKSLTDEDRADIREKRKDWILLFQLGEGVADDLDIMFGDSGNVYFWIRRQDLAERNFDNVWAILQCC